MSEATITSKGQVTIPADIRRSRGLHAGVRLSFTPMPDGSILLRAKTRSILDLQGILNPEPGVVVSIDDMRMT